MNKRRKYMTKWYEENKERIKLRQKEYYKQNKEKILARNKEWAVKNPEKVKTIRKRAYINVILREISIEKQKKSPIK